MNNLLLKMYVKFQDWRAVKKSGSRGICVGRCSHRFRAVAGMNALPRAQHRLQHHQHHAVHLGLVLAG